MRSLIEIPIKYCLRAAPRPHAGRYAPPLTPGAALAVAGRSAQNNAVSQQTQEPILRIGGKEGLGELTIPPPDGGTVTHHALDINGSIREAVTVDMARATQVFEVMQQREVDPGPLKVAVGNNTGAYSANIGRRSAGTEEVTTEKNREINRLIAKNPRLNAYGIDRRLIIKIPIDVRVVINRNMNNAGINRHVAGPIGECCYDNDRTRISRRISHGNTSGYRPEQFVLKNANRGKYGVPVNYSDAREFSASVPSTVTAEIYMKYADKSEQRQVVCLQLSNAQTRRRGDFVEVAEFEF